MKKIILLLTMMSAIITFTLVSNAYEWNTVEVDNKTYFTNGNLFEVDINFSKNKYLIKEARNYDGNLQYLINDSLIVDKNIIESIIRTRTNIRAENDATFGFYYLNDDGTISDLALIGFEYIPDNNWYKSWTFGYRIEDVFYNVKCLNYLGQ